MGEEKEYPRICGGSFFSLVLRARPKTNKVSNNKAVESLVLFYDPSLKLYTGESSYKTRVSEFINCAPNKKIEFAEFSSEPGISNFNSRIKDEYDKVLADFITFIDSIVQKDNLTWLCRAVLELISKDESISDDVKFYIKPDFNPVYKKELKSEKDFKRVNMYNFLLGIFHFVFNHCDDNGAGRETIERWKKEDYKNCVSEEWTANKEYVEDTVEAVEVDLTVQQEDAFVYVEEDGVAPDLGMVNPENIIFAKKSGLIEEETGYTRYLNSIRKKHRYLVTFLYENERDIKSFYVCNRLSITSNYAMSVAEVNKYRIIEEATIDKLPLANQEGIVISADGGMGKSMMLHRMVVDAVDRFEKLQIVPIFVTARLYNSKKMDFTDLVFTEYKRNNPDFCLSDLTALLKTGKAILLIDGIDEVGSAFFEQFMDELDVFKDFYPSVKYIISTRKHVYSNVLMKFVKYSLQPFDLQQAIDMVEKLDDKVVKKDTKEDFINSLKNGQKGLDWNKQKDFLGNPLLLTIMLLAYDDNYEIPSQRYLFYENAYYALAKKHDSTKGLIRDFKTGLSVHAFQLLFGEFCAVTYEKQKYAFNKEEILDLFAEIIKANDVKTTPELFLADVTEKLCMLYKEGDEYHFIHRSFQDYFAAYFFSKQDARYYPAIYEMFTDSDETRSDDEALPMLYGMAEQQTELHIIMPFLKEVLEMKYNYEGGHPNDNFFEFFDRFYGCVYFYDGKKFCEDYMYESSSMIYNFIRDTYGIEHPHMMEAPDELNIGDVVRESNILHEYYIVPPDEDSEISNPILMDKNDIGSDYFYEHPDAEPVGHVYELPYDDLTRNLTGEDDERVLILDFIFNEESPWYKEYRSIVNLYDSLQKKYAFKKDDNSSFLMKFH